MTDIQELHQIAIEQRDALSRGDYELFEQRLADRATIQEKIASAPLPAEGKGIIQEILRLDTEMREQFENRLDQTRTELSALARGRTTLEGYRPSGIANDPLYFDQGS